DPWQNRTGLVRDLAENLADRELLRGCVRAHQGHDNQRQRERWDSHLWPPRNTTRGLQAGPVGPALFTVRDASWKPIQAVMSEAGNHHRAGASRISANQGGVWAVLLEVPIEEGR